MRNLHLVLAVPVLAVGATALMVPLGVAVSASAGSGSTVIDRDDTAGPLDLVAARHMAIARSATRPARLELELVTYEAWAGETLAEDHALVSFEFDVRSDGRADRCLDIAGDPDGALEARVNVGCSGLPSARSGPFKVTRPDTHSVRVVIPRRSAIGRSPTAYRWRATSSFEDPSHADCAPSSAPPPEYRYATCTDRTRWVRIR
jgi:hypothetical protein